ncbi:GDSL-like lipase acylhydrolase [Raphidocelis subcapitata]|uniref:GDSL-like lipase acylhydrolase n=1 Tax=Raphidocelis subcapitata TaxID=307507 RepID=A0A2V0PHP9_9CHLO|nr:GDSL-like lipase acylhydrolase [Raphidocelis subcapitata]|eukprot:GBF99341.1 GDSL-like lipase acylhydrolase [Raphidocelis subcapitata]
MAGRQRALAALLALACAAALASAAQQPLGMRDVERCKQLRILAFGDSLTEGWIDSTEQKHPYTWNLEWRLRERLKPKGISVQITNGGVGSAGVLDRLNDAWYGRLREARDAGRPYQYAVFLAGINDILLQRRNAGDIIARMKEMWAAAAREGTTVVVIPTLPTTIAQGEATRRDLVGRIRGAVSEAQRGGDSSLQLLDLEGAFDWSKMPADQRSRILDDGLHLTDYGYQQYLSGLIYDGLVKILGI